MPLSSPSVARLQFVLGLPRNRRARLSCDSMSATPALASRRKTRFGHLIRLPRLTVPPRENTVEPALAWPSARTWRKLWEARLVSRASWARARHFGLRYVSAGAQSTTD